MSKPIVLDAGLYADLQREIQELRDRLRDTEARFDHWTANLPGVVYRYRRIPGDVIGEFLYISPGVEETYHLSAAAIHANPMLMWSRVHPDEVDDFQASIVEAIERGQNWRKEHRIVLDDGTIRWIQGIAHMEILADGTAISDGMLLDITDRKLAEAALAQEQDFVRLVVESVSDAVIACDATGGLKLLNRTAREWLGTDSPSLATTQWTDLHHLRDDKGLNPLPIEKTPLQRALTGESVRWATMSIAIPDQPLRLVISSADPLLAANGEQIGAVAIMHDITERRRNEEARRQLTRNLQEAQRIAHIGNWVFEPTTETLRWSTEIFRIFGRDPSLGEPDLAEFFAYYHPDDRSRLERAFRHCLRTGQAFDLEIRGQRTDGQVRYVQVKGESNKKDGRINHLVGVVMDITKRRQAEIQLYESQQLLLSVLDTIPQAVFWKDRQSKYLGCNQAFAESFGLSKPSQIIGKVDYDLCATREEADGYRAVDQDTMLNNRPHRRLMETMRRPDGSTAWLETNKVPLHDRNGQVVGVLGTFEDVTERRLAEEALQTSEMQLRQQAADLKATLDKLQRTQNQLVQSEKMSSLGQLVAGVAHEINNPVNFIFGNLSHVNEYAKQLLMLISAYEQRLPNADDELLDLIEDIDLEFLKQDLPKLLESMRVGAQRIREIVLSLRNFSRLDESEYKAVDLHEGLDSTLMILQHRLKSRPDHPGIQVIKNYSTLSKVECFAGQMNQVFMNILSNALDALEDRDREQSFADLQAQPSTITLTTALMEGDRVQIRIADNGPGIPDAVQQRLFDPFFTTKPIGQGTGLGMSISYQIVTDRHRGSLTCHSLPAGGAEFIIEIPCRQKTRKLQPN